MAGLRPSSCRRVVLFLARARERGRCAWRSARRLGAGRRPGIVSRGVPPSRGCSAGLCDVADARGCRRRALGRCGCRLPAGSNGGSLPVHELRRRRFGPQRRQARRAPAPRPRRVPCASLERAAARIALLGRIDRRAAGCASASRRSRLGLRRRPRDALGLAGTGDWYASSSSRRQPTSSGRG